jgi:ATP adenylyltransferase
MYMHRSDPVSRFQWITRSNPGYKKPAYDVIVEQTDHFVALPTLGSLVAGWLLLIPRRRVPSMAFLTNVESQELALTAERLTSRLKEFDRPVFQFEHGATTGSELACGVDHAHLHLVPLGFDLYEAAITKPEVRWHERFDLNNLPRLKGVDYLLIKSPDGRVAVGNPNRVKSQWFRRLIASELGMADRWDYKSYPELPMINETVSRVQAG